MRNKLFAQEDLDQFLDLFKQENVRELFITKPQFHYPNPGDYFAQHKHLRKTNVTPETALNAYKEQLIAKAHVLGLPDAKEQLLMHLCIEQGWFM